MILFFPPLTFCIIVPVAVVRLIYLIVFGLPCLFYASSSVNSQCSISEGTKGTEGNVPLLSLLVFSIVTAWNRGNYKGLDKLLRLQLWEYSVEMGFFVVVWGGWGGVGFFFKRLLLLEETFCWAYAKHNL